MTPVRTAVRSIRIARWLALLACFAALVAGTSAASAQPRRPRRPQAPPSPPTPTPQQGSPAAPNAQIVAIPMRPGEEIGNRLNEARRAIEEVEYERVVALLIPLRTLRDMPPTLGTEAALLETAALVALQRGEQATEACRRAVALAGHDPNVARSQSPRVQAVCTTAAEQARRELASTRRLAVAATTVRPGDVAWTPIRVEVRFTGDLTGLVTQAEVAIADRPTVTIGLSGADPQARAALLNADDAVPGARVQVTPLVRDAYGVLVRASTPTTVTVPRDEAAVRFAQGSDEGPLRVDGYLGGRRATVGAMVPLDPGRHTLEVQSQSGTARAQIVLRRGEVTLLTLRTTQGSSALAVFRWSFTGLAVVAAGTGAVLQVFAASNADQLMALSRQMDPATGLPLIRWSDVMSVDENRRTLQTAATGFFIGAGASAALAIVLWAVPSARPSSARNVGFAPGLGGGVLSVRF